MVSTTLPAWMCDSSDDDQDQVVPATPDRWMQVINEKFDNQTEDFKEKVEDIKDIFIDGTKLIAECMESSHTTLKSKIEEQANEIKSLKRKMHVMNEKMDKMLMLLGGSGR